MSSWTPGAQAKVQSCPGCLFLAPDGDQLPPISEVSGGLHVTGVRGAWHPGDAHMCWMLCPWWWCQPALPGTPPARDRCPSPPLPPVRPPCRPGPWRPDSLEPVLSGQGQPGVWSLLPRKHVSFLNADEQRSSSWPGRFLGRWVSLCGAQPRPVPKCQFLGSLSSLVALPPRNLVWFPLSRPPLGCGTWGPGVWPTSIQH